MEEGEFELCELLLGHGDSHLAVGVLELVTSPANAAVLLLGLALDKCLEGGGDTPVDESVEALVDATASSGAARDGTGGGGGGAKEVEEVELAGEGEGHVEGGHVFDEGEGGGLERGVGEGGRELERGRFERGVVIWNSGGQLESSSESSGTDLGRVRRVGRATLRGRLRPRSDRRPTLTPCRQSLAGGRGSRAHPGRLPARGGGGTRGRPQTPQRRTESRVQAARAEAARATTSRGETSPELARPLA